VHIFFVPSSNGFFIDEECFGDLGDRPSGSEEDDGFDAIRFFAIALQSVQRFERGDLFGGQMVFVHERFLACLTPNNLSHGNLACKGNFQPAKGYIQ
jgi:hypothetical protein